MNRLISSLLLTLFCGGIALADDLSLSLRYQTPIAKGADQFHRIEREESWKPDETAIIVCDMWDLHHCGNAVIRVNQIAPRLEKLLASARAQGVTIIHSPSSCMAFYKDHPARKRAQETPRAADMPKDISSWCTIIPAEEKAPYPIDQSDGGEDDDPEFHQQWAKKLEDMGRNPRAPWVRQVDTLSIDPKHDYISDSGEEVWSVLADRKINNVILTGVHTNMCVLGRPFGLRQMAKNGKNVVLMRDLTDTMYNPKAKPYVSHFTGTDLIVSHIERHVCPTIDSTQLIGGEPLVFAKDTRPHVVIVMAEREYETNITLPKFALEQLGQDFRVSYVHADAEDRNNLHGYEVINEADILLISVRRRALPPVQLKAVRDFVEAGKPLIGIRTASHAFSLRGADPPKGHAVWKSFDADVFGGNYSNHYGNKLACTVRIKEGLKSPLLSHIERKPFAAGGSLYVVSPLADSATVLATGEVEGKPAEPVAWTFKRKDGGESFYTSLGHKQDFANRQFVQLLRNSVYWAAGLEPAAVERQNSEAASR